MSVDAIPDRRHILTLKYLCWLMLAEDSLANRCNDDCCGKSSLEANDCSVNRDSWLCCDLIELLLCVEDADDDE